jgi:hypothetical protein
MTLAGENWNHMVPRFKVNNPFTYAFNNPAAQKSQQLNIVWNKFLLYPS